MDLLKSKIYLDKLNREYVRMTKDPDNIARIDIDIMASYVRELYDAILSQEVTASARKQPLTHRPLTPEVPPVPVVVPEIKPVEPAPVVTPPPPPVAVAPPPPPSPVVVPPVPQPVEDIPVVIEAVRPPASEPHREEHVHHARRSHPSHADTGYEILFEEKQAKELSEKLSEMPIADLRRAIALNDRLLLTRELFAGDGQSFESSLNALNGFSNFTEAKTYLIEHGVVRYGWTDKKRMETAKDFIKLVRRRYK